METQDIGRPAPSDVFQARVLRRHRGFSLFELMVVAVLFGIVAMVLLNRLRYYQETAEKAGMEYTASAIKSMLRIRMAALLIQGRAQEYRFLAEDNPMDWLDTKPGNYLGRLVNPDVEELPKGNWYFDSASRTLVYLIKRGEHFQTGSGERQWVRFRVILVPNFADVPANGSDSHLTDSVRFTLLEPYKWF